MATNSDIYHTYGIQGFDVVRTQYVDGTTILHLRHAHPTLRCPKCKQRNFTKNGTGPRTFRLTPTGSHPALAVLQTQRIRCLHCQFSGQLHIPFAYPRCTYTRGFARYALELMRFGTIEHVAKHLGVGWDMVKDIHKRHLLQHFSKPSLKNIRTIAIDEFYAGRKTGYYTFVLDLTTGAIVHVGRGKGAAALQPFWRRIRNLKGNIVAVAMDMSKAYIAAVREHLPAADIVFDPFHIVKHMNEKIDQLRRNLCRELHENDRAFMKGKRWLLLKGAENLSRDPNPKRDNKSEVQLLAEALEVNRPLSTAYYLKEDLRRLWDFRDASAGATFLTGWSERANASELKPLVDMVKTLTRHREGILAYFTHRITSGPMEAMNNKIRVLQRQTYGLRDQEYWALRVKALHREETRLSGSG